MRLRSRIVRIAAAVAVGVLIGTGAVSPAAGAVGPVIHIDPVHIDFGAVRAGTSSAAVTITIKNVGDADLSVSTALQAPIDFRSTSACGTTLAPGLSCHVYAGFVPSA